MNTYEFWNDMDKIYEAIVAYQEKTIEFNKQFINPWVKLGNVFDKNESTEEIIAHKNAIEIDPKNAQNWYELANIYTRFGDFDKSIQAYQKTIELGFESGELYKNLALAYTITAKYQDAIPVFKKALEMLESNNEKALVWNHLGNAYRKLDNYEMALQAFQQADQFETALTPTVEELPATASQEDSASPSMGEPIAVTESIPVPKDSAQIEKDTVLINDLELDEPGAEQEEDIDHAQVTPVVNEVELPVAEENQVTDENDESDNDMQVVLEIDFSSGAINEETEVTSSEEEIVAEIVAAPERNEESETLIAAQDENKTEEAVSKNEDYKSISMESIQEELDANQATAEDEPASEILVASDEVELPFSSTYTNDNNEEVVALQVSNAAHALSAYEEYLEDNDPVGINLAESASDETQTVSIATADVAVTNSEVNMETSADLTIEMDSKSAHVWNELGNVYFNAGSFDDAIAAYSKAIELDAQFAWPYTNLASSYVHKERLADAISMYKRGIELFSNDKDKAVAWNQMGNVYRQMNDYGNAIAAYQRADELDPGNAAATQQSRFSLLGSEKVVQEAGYSV